MKRITVRTLYGSIRLRFLSENGEVVGEVSTTRIGPTTYEWTGRLPSFVSHIQVLSGDTYLSPDKYKLEVKDL